MTYATFARQSAGGAAPEASRERLKNWFAEPFPDGGTTRLTLLPCTGLGPFADGLGGPVRAVYATVGDMYAAAGGFLWKITLSGETESIGPIIDSPATTIAGNGYDVTLAAGGKFYVWDGENFYSPDAGAFGDVGSVAETSGYVILFEKAGQRFSITKLADAGTVDALDFASAEANPDVIVRGMADHGDLWIFGEKTTEIWANTSDAVFPFSRYTGGTHEVGIAWQNACVSADNGVWWIGSDRVVYRGTVGGAPQRTSTARVEAVLQALSKNDDVRMLTYDDRGHKFVAIRLPNAPAWAFDISTGLWHERSTGIGDQAWMGTDATPFAGADVIGGSDGALHRLSGLTDGGFPIEREAISVPIDGSGDYLTLAQVKLHFGHGRTDLRRQPLAMVQASRDGRTWDREREVKMGLLGEYGWQCWVNGLGRARSFTLRVRITDSIDVPMLGTSYTARK